MSFKVRPPTEKENTVVDTIQGRVRINIEMSPEKRHEFRVKAMQERTTISELVNKWIDEYLSK